MLSRLSLLKSCIFKNRLTIISALSTLPTASWLWTVEMPKRQTMINITFFKLLFV